MWARPASPVHTIWLAPPPGETSSTEMSAAGASPRVIVSASSEPRIASREIVSGESSEKTTSPAKVTTTDPSITSTAISSAPSSKNPSGCTDKSKTMSRSPATTPSI